MSRSIKSILLRMGWGIAYRFPTLLPPVARFLGRPEMGLPETADIICASSPSTLDRLNLLVPAISDRNVFGGIATALALFKKLSKYFARARIVVLDEGRAAIPRDAYFSSWPIWRLGDADLGPNCIVYCNRRAGSLPVAKGDYFVATAWWTAYIARRILGWQERQFGVPHKFVYLIQDFEPAFYPWSSRYALAQSTYEEADCTVPVFNTKLLRDYFEETGIKFKLCFTFEPHMNDAMRKMRNELAPFKKARRIIVYGRPSVQRNAFAILLQGLRQWSERYGAASDWRLFSGGEAHPDVRLTHAVVLRSLGKMLPQDYAECLAASAIGVSLMLSPHPSYPPLEMATFGCDVITNTFAAKDLSGLSPRIRSLPNVSADALADALIELCDRFEREGGVRMVSLEEASIGGEFLQQKEEFEFCAELAVALRQPSENRPEDGSW